MTKKEFEDFQIFNYQRTGIMGTRSSCNPRYDKYLSAADRAGTWTRCALSNESEDKCKTDDTCEWDREFRPDEEWKGIAYKAGVLPTS